MIAKIEEIDGELCLVFPEEECPFSVGDEIEWTLENNRIYLRVVQPDLFGKEAQ